MTSTEPRTDIFDPYLDEPLSEQLLLSAARDGSTGAFGVLYARHRDHAVAVARRALPPGDGSQAEDVAEMAFIRVFGALRNGKGPTDTLRYYLATSVRREAWRSQRRRRRQAEVVGLWSVDEAAIRDERDGGQPPSDEHDLDRHVLLGEAFRGLSERWRHVLWLTEVEGRKPAEIAPMLGLTAGSASALAYRARQGLLLAYLSVYRNHSGTPACKELTERLGLYVAAGRITQGFDDVVAHLEGCASCRDVCRGVDVVGGVLGALAPFGLLTVGLWAKGVAAGSSAGAAVAVAAGAGAAGAAGASGAAGSGGASVAGGAGGASGTLVAAGAIAAAVLVVAGAAYAGFGGNDRGPTGAAGASSTSGGASAGGIDGDGENTPTSGPVATTAADRTTSTAATPSTSTTRDQTTTPIPTTTPIVGVLPTTPRATTTTTSPRTTTTTTTTTTAAPTTTTSTTVPAGGSVYGQVVLADGLFGALDLPLQGVTIEVRSGNGDLVGSDITDFLGNWSVGELGPGQHRVVAVISADYRPETGADPWVSGPTWSLEFWHGPVTGTAVAVGDFRVVAR